MQTKNDCNWFRLNAGVFPLFVLEGGADFAYKVFMEIRRLLAKVVITPVFCCLAALSVNAATICVGPSATGNGSGADWNNQAAWGSISFARGNTYYLADGSYSGKTFTTAASGSTYITIKKATVGDSAVQSIAGWTSTLGDGQAAFTSSCNFSSSYWIFDGVKGGGFSNGAPDKSPGNYGFVFTDVAFPLNVYNTSANISDVTLSHVASTAPTGDVEKHFVRTHNATRSVIRMTVSYCYAYGFNNYTWGTSAGIAHLDWIHEHNVFLDLYCTAAHHGEFLNNNFGNIQNWTIRHNWLEGIRSGSVQPTMIVGALNGDSGPYYIYGNVFKDVTFTDGGICAVNNGYGPHTLSGAVYNNTFVNAKSSYSGVQIVGGAGANSMTVQNNLFVNMPVSEGTSGVFSHNAYYNTSSRPSESSQQILSSDPFVSASAANYRLTVGTSAGAVLPGPYDKDGEGNSRGADGTWDRGAFEWTGSTSPSISVSPTGQDFGSVATGSTRDLSFTVRNSGGGTVSGTASVTAPFSVVSGGSYSLGAGQSQTVNIRFSPTTAGSQSRVITFTGGSGTTATVSGTGATPDNTPPSAGLSSPANGTITSNMVTIAATVNDNGGVVGVRFFVGSTQMFDDTSAPYSFNWDSSAVGNGSYQVYVQARDAAGNTTWSGTNTITIANPPVTMPSPLAYWDFNGGGGASVTDKQNNIVLTLRNGAAASAAGKMDAGLLLDGLNDWADAPNTTTLNVTGTALTVAAWVKLENQGTWQQIVTKVKETNAFSAPYFAWHVFGSHASATQWTPHFQLVNSSGNSVDVGSSLNVNYGEWVHVVGVYDGTAVRVYVNGANRGSAAQSGAILGYNQPLYIGAHGAPGEFSKGVVDEVRIYGQALTANQVQALYANVGTQGPAAPSGLRVVSN